MASSGGDRRWASARRGGMTVLGKVAVPKPINLPSQRLENHGLDPNVEIVPKGTLSWGSQPSSSTSNAWGSSLSPSADSSSNSPSHLSTRPSSDEAGTRPSTAGCDKVHDSTLNVWSSDSRPSSASGALMSSQASLASLRPCSAEPRPGSSQLSRFAEPPIDISVAGSGERLEVTSSKNDGFSLSTGDFPSLGSVKSSSGKNSGSQGPLDPAFHGSGSADGVHLAEAGSENRSVGDASLSTDGKTSTDNLWRKDSPPYGEDGCRVGIEKWNGGTAPNESSGILPQHFNAWCGPPVNNPAGGIWYRGPAGEPPPYGGPVPLGGFPMEPFCYYHPQISVSTLPIPSPGAVPRGPQPKTGDMYGPQTPDAYIHPGMPVRTGFYSGPVPYDGYFCPPTMGYYGQNDQDIPIMGMAGGPSSIHRQFPGQNVHDAGNSHIRPPGHGSSSKGHGLEEVESGHHDPREPYRVLLKPHVNWNEKSEAQKLEETQRSSGPSMEKVDFTKKASSWESDWRVESRKDCEKDLKVRAVGESASSQNIDSKASGSVVPSQGKAPENLESARFDGDHARAEQKNFVAAIGPQSAAPKDSSLIQKIEGLNAKARASDMRPDVMFVSEKPEEGNKWQVHGVKSGRSPAESGSHAPYSANVQAAPGLSTEEVLEETAVSGPNTSRRYHHGRPGKAYHHRGRGRFISEDVDGFQKKPVASDPILPIPLETSDVHRQTGLASQHTKTYEGGYVPVTSGHGDSKAERAKMKEQRMKERHEEEEECAREKKPKAQMKLEELNRRKQVVEGSNSNIESGILDNSQDLAPPVESKTISNSSVSSSCAPVPCGHLVPQNSHRRNDAVGRSGGLSKEFPREPSKALCKESAIIHNQSVPLQQGAEIADADNCGVAPHVHSSSISKQFWTGYKQKQNMVSEKNNSQKIANEPPKSQVHVAYDVTTTVDVGADSLAHQRSRSNRGNRNKSKGDESSPANSFPSLAPNECGGIEIVEVLDKKKREKNKLLKVSDCETDHSVLCTLTESNDVNQLLEECLGSAHEEAQVRGGDQWRSQPSRRALRNQQVSRATDKFHSGDAAVWTPVHALNKIEIVDETSKRTAAEGLYLSVKIDQPLQNNNPRNKRAEIERYVPKPVAKGTAQGSVHLQMAVLESLNKTVDEAVHRGDSGSISVAVKESRNADSRQNRSARGHGSWRQRGTTDTVNLEGLPIGQCQSHFSQMGGNVQKLSEHYQGPKPEEKPTREQDGGLSCDGFNIPCGSSNSTSQSQVTSPAVRSQGTPVKGERHPPLRGPKGDGYSLYPDQRTSSFESVRSRNPSVAPEVSQIDTAAPAPRDNQGAAGQSTLHWQPKSKPVSCQNYWENGAAGGGQNTAESGGFPMEEASKEHDEACDYSASVKDNMREEAGQSEIIKRERRPQSFAACHQSPSQVPLKSQESAGEQQEAGFSTGPRKNGNQNTSRFVRRDESCRDRNSSSKDTRRHNVSAHWERQRYSSNYKYQPVGMYNNGNKLSHFEGLRDGSQNTDPRHGEGW